MAIRFHKTKQQKLQSLSHNAMPRKHALQVWNAGNEQQNGHLCSKRARASAGKRVMQRGDAGRMMNAVKRRGARKRRGANEWRVQECEGAGKSERVAMGVYSAC